MITDFFDIDRRLYILAEKAEEACTDTYKHIEAVAEHNAAKVLKAFIDNRVSEGSFHESTGYGYDDQGRECLEKVYAQIFGAEDALVRHNFVSGTHAISTALFGILRPSDRMVSITGLPYDTLHGVIGLNDKGQGSLQDFGIQYEQIDLINGKPDYDTIKEQIYGARIAYIQRSRGYSLRPSLSVAEIENLVKVVKSVDPRVYIVVDNCYGEYVDTIEPTQVGADLLIGSMIKNPGGGIAKTGGYIVGKKELVELCAYRLTIPGAGKELGCTLGENRSLYLGTFHAPTVTANALKTACFASKLFADLGFDTYPSYTEFRSDIITSINLHNADLLKAFCRGVQKGSPIDAFVTPEPWPMPGYTSDVIMAAGAFTSGSSIELSADGPMREPYTVFLQGGITYPSGKIGILLAAQSMLDAMRK